MGATSPRKPSPAVLAKQKARAAAKAKIKKAEKDAGGRLPKLIADEATLAKIRTIARLQSTHRQAAGVLEVALSTFEEFMKKPVVQQVWESGMQQGLVSLRSNQFKQAEKNAQMAIHLGKNYLDQTDKVTNEISGPGGKPIEHRDLSGYSHEQLDALERAALALARGTEGAAPGPERIPDVHSGRADEEASGGSDT
jgi:hypothetical protein